MAEADSKKGRTQSEVLFAIRMNWLNWLSKPIQLVWFVIVQAALAAWRLITISFTALKGCYSRLLLERSFIGASIFFAVVLLGFYLAGLTDVYGFIPIMLAVSVLPMAWTMGEATAVSRAQQDKKKKITAADVPMGNGLTVAGTMALYVVVIIVALVAQALISMLMSIPGIGPVLLGIILIPNVLLSVLLVMAIILLVFGILALPSYLLMEDKGSEKNIFKRFLQLNGNLLTTLRSQAYWVQLLVIAPFAAFFATVVAIPIMALMGISTGLSVGVMTGVTAFSETAQQSLAALSQVTGGSFALGYLPVSAKIGVLFIALAFSVLLGAATSPVFGAFASIYHVLYRRRAEGKTWTYLVMIPVLALVGMLLVAIGGSIAGAFFYF